MKEMIKRTAVVSIITSLIFAVLGIVMIANPEAAIEIVAAVLGITVIVIGAEKIISYFVMKGNLDFFNYELIYGIVAILFGILIMTHSNTFASIERIIIGIAYCTKASGLTSIPTEIKNTAPNRSLTGCITFSIRSASFVPAKIEPMTKAPKAEEKPA